MRNITYIFFLSKLWLYIDVSQRDEKKARILGLPFMVIDIINLPIEAFNELLTKHNLTENQIKLCQDIRRRHQNKVSSTFFYFLYWEQSTV